MEQNVAVAVKSIRTAAARISLIDKMWNFKKNLLMEQNVNVNEVARISAGTIVRGDMYSVNDIRVDGTFEGKIYSKGKVVVGENALVKGFICCEFADFWGTMDGDFYIKDTLSLKNTAKVKGALHIHRLQVDLDAQINGECSMITEEDYDKFVSKEYENMQ